jgi:serine/threonine protein kinase
MSAVRTSDPQQQGHGFEGRVLGGFRLLREIACGGMATVYMAHKSGPAGFGQAAAVKVIHPHLARDREFVEMFLDEARIVSCINHPNVCRVLDFGKAEGTYYLAMEYVMGETWGDVLHALKQRPSASGMIPAILAQVLAQACEGLHAAHEARDAEGRALSIVHRDISPQNLIVGYDGSVRVLDFGIASAAERLHTTRNGTIKGRFAYMAPEQMRGMPVDRRADLWSLGVVCWEGLAQKRLFKRDTEAETVLAVTQDPLPSLAEVGHPVPSPMAKVATQALSRNRDERYGTAREMGLELSRFASSSLVPVGMAEVSLWMSRLFAQRIDEKRASMREAARAAELDKAQPPSLPPHTPTVPLAMMPDDLAKQSGSSNLPSVSTVREVRGTISIPPVKRFMFGPLLGICAFLFVALLGAWLAPYVQSLPFLAPLFGDAPRLAPVAQPGVAPQAQHSTARAAPEPPPVVEPAAPEAPPPQPARAEPARVGEEQGSRVKPRERTRAEPTKPHARASKDESSSSSARKRLEAAAAFGSVSVATSGGWADVYVGSKKLGTTPGRFELPVGTHTLRLRPFGKTPEITKRIEVSQDHAVKLKVPLE